jgi:DNA-binding NarL/FixJ family response regulator
MEAPLKTNVLIADDHPIVLSGVRAELSRHSDFEIVGEAVTTDEVLEQVDALRIDVIILDLNMPGTKAMDVIKRLKKTHPKIKILVLTAHGDKGTALGVLRAGADGYVLKDEDPDIIPDAIYAVMNGKNWVSPSIVTFTIERAREIKLMPGLDLLTEKECEILRLIAQGMTTKDISARTGMAARTVEFHITNIYEKLGVNSRASAVHWATENGVI